MKGSPPELKGKNPFPPPTKKFSGKPLSLECAVKTHSANFFSHGFPTKIVGKKILSTSSLIWPSYTKRATIFEKVLGPKKFPKTEYFHTISIISLSVNMSQL